MGFDPESIFGRRPRPRVIKPGRPGMAKGRIVGFAILGVLILLLVLGRTLLGLRVDYLFFSSLDHTNVFWTPFVTQVVLFVMGFALTGLLLALNIPAWRAAARPVDQRGAAWALGAGIAIAVVAGIGGGIYLAGQWQDFLLFTHGHSFGATDPVFGQDYSFYMFTLPVLDAFQGIGWAVALLSLAGALGMAVLGVIAANTPADIPLPLRPVEGRDPDDGVAIAARHAGVALIAIFVLAALGAHFGVYHLTVSDHSDYNFVGLDATQRNVVRPVLGVLQWVALAFAAVTALILVTRWHRPAPTLGGSLAGFLILWLVISGLAQVVPPLVYEAAYATPNAQTAQLGAINDFLDGSRYAWGLQGTDVSSRTFNQVTTPTLNDLAADPGTLKNVRLQDYRQLPDTLAQIDRTRNYQTYPRITVDRYATSGGDVEVMIGPREIKSSDVPGGFISQNLIYTHGYGYTAVSVNRIGTSGTPYVVAGGLPGAVKLAPDAAPALATGTTKVFDPRIYCGVSSSQPSVVVNTNTAEFDYPSEKGDQTSQAGTVRGVALSSWLDRLSLSVVEFGGTDLLLTNQLTDQSQALVHRNVTERIQTLAPFLTVDADPYVVVDPDTNHMMYIADAYVKSDRFPNAYRLSDGTSYQRNAVKAVVDAKTCETTLYAVDLNEPMTATYDAIYPGLLTPLDKMPMFLKQHLRYPEDLFKNQAQVYAQVHVSSANVYFNRSDRYRIAQEIVDNKTVDTDPYYVELTLPNDPKPTFVLLQTFSPGSGSGSGTSSANNMTAWLAAQCDYTTTAHPQLVSVPLNNAANVLGPLQFDNNLNTDPIISKDISLLGQRGSTVILGNVIVLPFNNHSFLYVRPLYVAATSGGSSSFPQMQRVLVGTQNAVAEGNSFPEALQALFKTSQPIPGLDNPTTTTPPTATPSPNPTQPAQPSVTLTAQEIALVTDLLSHQAAADAASRAGDYATSGVEQAAVKKDADQLRQLLAQSSPAPAPSAAASPSPS